MRIQENEARMSAERRMKRAAPNAVPLMNAITKQAVIDYKSGLRQHERGEFFYRTRFLTAVWWLGLEVPEWAK